MKNAIRCCISCILPCGALDVIRIVHTNGRVEEISGGGVTAAEIMKLHPKHVLKKPSSPSESGMCPRIVVVPPDAELKRGKIYFLMPLPPPPPEKSRSRSSAAKRKRRESAAGNRTTTEKTGCNISMANLLLSDRYLSEILSEKISTQRDRRRGRVGVWRPHLESISEAPALEGRKHLEKVELRTRDPETVKYVERKMEEKGVGRLDRHPADGLPLRHDPKKGHGGKYTWEGPRSEYEAELEAEAAVDDKDPNYVEEAEAGDETAVVGEVETPKVAEEGVARVEVDPRLNAQLNND